MAIFVTQSRGRGLTWPKTVGVRVDKRGTLDFVLVIHVATSFFLSKGFEIHLYWTWNVNMECLAQGASLSTPDMRRRRYCGIPL